MEVLELLLRLKENDIDLELSGDDIEVHYDGVQLPEELYTEIAENKQAIVSYLKALYSDRKQTITVQARPDRIPLSYAQERMWFINELEGSGQYHIPTVLRLTGKVDTMALETAMRQIVNRHEVLRTVIREQEGVACQKVLTEHSWKMRLTDGENFGEDKLELQGYIEELMEAPFDLSQDFMLRAELIRLQAEEHILVVVMHHIASDGWSRGILVRELTELYGAAMEGRQADLAPLPIQYADYALWQRRYVSGGVLEGQLGYWKEKLRGVAALELPTDLERPAVRSHRGAVKEFWIDKGLLDGLQELSGREGVTLYMTLLAAFQVLLARYSGQKDIAVGSPVGGRTHEELEGLVGFFISTVVMRSEVRGDMSFIELMQAVKETTLGAYEHQDAPFEKVVEAVVSERDLSRSPLFQALLSVQNMSESPALRLGDLELRPLVGVEQTTAQFDLSFLLEVRASGMFMMVEYCTDLFRLGTVKRIAGHYKELLRSIVADSGESVGRLGMLTEGEERQVLEEFNNTYVDYPRDKTVVDLFELQAAKSPEVVAVVFEGRELSYGELDRRSNQLGHYLRGLGVREDSLVPICVERSVEMIIGILGILKAGGAYVPIDPGHPGDRIRYMLDDIGASRVVTHGAGRAALAAAGLREWIDLDDWAVIGGEPNGAVPRVLRPDHLAYMIYTSGSTGRPKGVLVEHGGLLNRLLWAQDYFGLRTEDVVLQKTTYGFDVSVWELLWPLLVGAKLLFARPGGQGDSGYLREVIESSGVTMIHFVPSMLEAFVKDIGIGDCSGLKKVLCSGEALRLGMVRACQELLPQARIYNLYGPTEATVDVSCWSVPEGRLHSGVVPIGRPVANTQLYVVDGNGFLCPVGVPGELWIGGVQVARGYWKRAELTAEKFVANPFGEGRLYKTGDRCRWRADGTMEYLGRRDEQVKVRGYRIELGEIESVLDGCAGVRQGVVTAREDAAGNKRLVGYVVAEGGMEKAVIEEYLGARLPEYMVPRQWVKLEALPLTGNGKVDRKRLPEPDMAIIGKEYVAARNAIEEALATIWREVLSVERVGIYDNFFELGGHSLLATRVVSAARRQLGKELVVRSLFRYSTIAGLADHLREASAAVLPPVMVLDRPDRIPLSYAQERLWFIDKLEGSVAYHLLAVLRLDGDLNAEALERALRAIVNRHEVLRTVIREQEGVAYQEVLDKDRWKMGRMEGLSFVNDPAALQECIGELTSRPFDLSADHMLRGELIGMTGQENILVVTVHHIAADGWSVGILVRELTELYNANIEGREVLLPVLPVQYADYALWQQRYVSGEVLEEKLGYWKEKLKGVSVLDLPTDHERPAVQSHRGAARGYWIGEELIEPLRALSNREGVTLYMTLLAAFQVLLSRYSGQEDICVGSPVAGRTHAEVEGLVGFFVNSVPLRSAVRGEESFRQLLQQVRETTLGAYEHQEAPFEKVVEAVVKERDLSRSALFQVMFTLQNTPDKQMLRLGEVKLRSEGAVHMSQFELTFNLEERGSGLNLGITYCTDLFGTETIDRMAGHYQELLRSITAAAGEMVGRLRMLTAGEQRQMLEFNDTYVDHPRDKTLVDLFEAQAEQTPEAVALVYEGQELTYGELDQRSDLLGHYLRGRGVKEDSLVPICVERSIEMIVGILGILKAGGAYVPIDPEYPAERIEYLLEDTDAAWGVTNSAGRLAMAAGGNCKWIDLDDWVVIGGEPAGRVPRVLRPDHLAYMIYTSGSTGRPKGVMIEHGSIANFIQCRSKAFGIHASDRVVQFSNYGFDASVEQIFLALCNGAMLVLIPRQLLGDPQGFSELLRNQQITHLDATPGFLETLIPYDGMRLRRVIAGGDICSRELAKRWHGRVNFYNEYGPTEATVVATAYQYSEEGGGERKSVSIGRPLDNVRVYIMDGNGEMCPIGVPGELWIGGVQVARGYWKRSELTAEKFVSDPYGQGRIYKTGDIGCWREDGMIEYLGRKDEQVKVRGYRIELGEIESVVGEYPGVGQAVILAWEDVGGNKRLAGYVVMEGVMDKEAIERYLQGRLPEFMVPRQWVQLERIPLTAHGKVDRRNLPEPELALTSQEYVAPRNPVEEVLVAIWRKVLGIERIGIHDNFFEMGGHSLLATRVVSAVRLQLGKELAIRSMFRYPTVSGLAMHLRELSGAVLPPVTMQVRPERIPLSYAQERLWFIDKLEGSVQYHLPAVLRLKGVLDGEALGRALREVVNRHEVLRTVIREQEGMAYQLVLGRDRWVMGRTDGAKFGQDIQGLQGYIRERIAAPFDLSADDMLRAELIGLREDEHILVVTLHHIASDGWSLGILVRELTEGYSAATEGREVRLAPLPVQYADYALWQRRYMSGDALERQLGYWEKKLKGASVLELPADYERPAVLSHRGDAKVFWIDKGLQEGLQELSGREGVTLYMTLLAAFQVLLSRYSGQEDICVGSPVAGRTRQEVEGLVGFFINTVVIRSEVRGEAPFRELLQAVKETTLGAYEHQEAPFEKVVEAVVKDRDRGRSPLFTIKFGLHNLPPTGRLDLGQWVDLTGLDYSNNTTQVNISLDINILPGGLQASLTYSRDLYEGKTIDRMARHYEELLRSIVADAGEKVGELRLLTVGEERQLLEEFNDTVVAYPRDRTVVELFGEWVVRSPEAVAVVYEGQELTYEELDRRSNQLGHYLRGLGVKEETLVGICVERGIEMIVGILGIMKAGGAYVPIDPGYPTERIEYVLEDADVAWVLVHAATKAVIQRSELIELDDWSGIGGEPTGGVPRVLRPDHLAYVIYTSGSTGRPKGVMIEHGSLMNLALSQAKGFGPIAGTRTLQFSSFGFDAFCWELFITLAGGGCLVLARKEALLSADSLGKLLEQERIDIVTLPASLLGVVKGALTGVKTVVSAGEALNREAGEYLRSQSIGLINAYGPTENTVCATLSTDPIGPEGVVIGKPIDNVTVTIRDVQGLPVPIGVPGELWIGGVQVARGYWRRPELSAEKFVTDPYGQGRVYKTGDIGRWRPDGTIEYLGRKDEQVKVRGYRIELGEIESVLGGFPEILQCVVVAREDASGSRGLVAYVVADGSLDKGAMEGYLEQRLPEYMVPRQWVKLERIPLTVHGKVDRKALPEPEGMTGAGQYVAPGTGVERVLASIWQELLSVERIGIYDNFFELGGHSLLAIRMISAVRKALSAEMAIGDIFEHPTIAALAERWSEVPPGVVIPAITAGGRPERIPLSYAQERLWFIDNLEGSLQYHLPAVLRLKGDLDREALERALRTIVNRHEVLRTVIRQEDGMAYQHVLARDLWTMRYSQDQGRAGEIIGQPFDLSEDFMLRAELIGVGVDEHILVVVLHHIAADAWSLGLLVSELTELYTAITEEREAMLKSLPIQYADYAIWQRTYMSGEVLEQKLDYWRQELKAVEALQLPTDHLRPAVESHRGDVRSFWIDAGLRDELHTLSQQQGATLYMTLLAAFQVLLSRYSGQEDICVGSPIAGRTQQEVEGMVGFFINMLALRSEVKADRSFIDLLEQVRQRTLSAYEHQEVPFEKVVEALVEERDLSRSPLFQVSFSLHNTPESPALRLGSLELSGMGTDQRTAQLELGLYLQEHERGISLDVVYCTDLFGEETIDRMMRHYLELLRSIVRDAGEKIGRLTMLTAGEERQLLKVFNDTSVDYPHDKTVVSLFEEQAAMIPDAVALMFEGETMTYKELDRRSNQLGHYLRRLGVREDMLVGICVERGMEMIVGVLGILKAGGAYVPIDPGYPEERIGYMLGDSGIKVIVCDSDSRHCLPTVMGYHIVELDRQQAVEIDSREQGRVVTSLSPNHLAYVIYTSGSTGRPKGVLVEHRSVINLIYCQSKVFGIDSSERIAQFSNYGFDASVEQLFLALCNGATLVGVPRRLLTDPQGFAGLLEESGVTHLHATPGFLETLEAGDSWSLKRMIAGGDSCSAALARRWGSLVDFYNEYGPTETTVTATEYRYDAREDNGELEVLPIGRPLANTSIYILDGRLQPTAVGVPGELYIGGVPVARGYLNRPELTAEQFVANPHGEGRLYRTGDMGRWRADGTIEFLGRRDEQVKVRGYRIELGEIEGVLVQCPGVRQGVVVAMEDGEGSKRLVGYVVPVEDLDIEEIQTFLQKYLPDYMVPVQWVELPAIPLTANGKVDRKGLPEPEMESVGYVMPRTKVERVLAGIWEELLELERVGIHDNFFALGGHSLLAIRVISAVRKVLSVELGIGEMFEYPTIAELAAHLSAQVSGGQLPPVTVQERPERIPLSYAQERLWFIDELEGSVQYHVPSVLRLKGKLDKNALEGALRTIVNRHEVLRTVIRQVGGVAYQEVLPIDIWTMSYHVDNTLREDAAELEQYINTRVAAPFDLSRDAMLRAELMGVCEDEHILVMVLHHIASDGWSISILVRELVELYAAAAEGREAVLRPLPVQYADYAIWQRKHLSSGLLEKKLAYWKQQLNGVVELQLPTDHIRPAEPSRRGDARSYWIGAGLRDSLQDLSQQQGVTLYMTLLAAFQVLLSRYSGQEDICVGSPIAGRTQQEVEGMVGFFINMLALRSEVKADRSFIDLLQQVRERTLGAYEHQEVPFEKVVEAVVDKRDLSRSPVFHVLFSLQNIPESPRLRLGELELSGVGSAHQTTQFELNVSLRESDRGIQMEIAYSTDLYGEETIGRMARHYEQLLRSIVRDAHQPVGKLAMLTADEEQQVLRVFNDTAVDYPRDRTFIELFEEQVAIRPEEVAVIHGEQEMTYDELDRRSNQLGHYLQGLGVKEDSLVPICVERGMEMIVGILGIWKAGGAYVPIDPAYPPERIAFMLEDTGSDLMVTSGECRSKAGAADGARILVEIDAGRIDDRLVNGPVYRAVGPHHLAYMIYTSGSTGRPKGVMIEHRSLLNYLLTAASLYNERKERGGGTVLHLSYAFDASVTGLFVPLLSGRKLVLGEWQKQEVFRGADVRQQGPYDFIKLTPGQIPMLEGVIDEDGRLLTRRLVVGGEVLHSRQLKYLADWGLPVEIINEYGPTEATVGSTVFRMNMANGIKEKGGIPIGRPLPNTRVYIVDRQGQPVPVGVPGELWIGGAQIARGYWKRPELTAEKFVVNPFDDGKVYKTGDLGRWRSDGTIEYIGRGDEQVKVRGYRIELGEIESVLSECPGVRGCVVVAREDEQGDKRLAGYVVPEEMFDKQVTEDYLRERLPEYMVPRQWVQLEVLPLTANGKVDRKGLPEPGFVMNEAEYVAPRNELEAALAGIWREVLGLERVGIYNNFFEMGGDSIIAIQMVSRLRRAGYSVQLQQLFQYQTIARLSAAVPARGGDGGGANGEQGLLRGEAGLLPIQRWFLEDGEQPGYDHFNQSVLLSMDKGIGEKVLRAAVEELVARHDSWRMRYYRTEAGWHQEYGEGKGELLVEDLRELGAEELAGRVTVVSQRYQESLSIGRGEVVRIVWMRMPEMERYDRLLVVAHHLVVDGVSWRVVLEDVELLLSELSKGERVDLGKKSSSYREWYAALEKYGRSERARRQLGYWQGVTSSLQPLKTDRGNAGRAAARQMGGVVVKLGAGLTRQLLQEVPGVYHTEINDVLLSALAWTLVEWNGTSEVVIGLEGHGRESGIAEGVDMSRTVGWFTTLYPVLLKGEGQKGPGAWLRSVKEQLRRVPDKGVGYGVLKYINREEGLGGADPWEVVFNYLGQFDQVVKKEGLIRGAGERVGETVSGEYRVHERLVVNSHVGGGELVLQWSYSSLHYEEGTVRRIAEGYVDHLTALIGHCVGLEAGQAQFTPSDFGLGTEVNYEELDSFLNSDDSELDNIMNF